MRSAKWWALFGVMVATGASGAELPTIRVTADDKVIDRSCRIEIPAGIVIEDANDNGVIHIRASGVTIEFAEKSILRGANPGKTPDSFQGIGIRVEGQSDVSLRNVAVSGFRVGVYGLKADRLLIENSNGSGNRRARLRSTPLEEAAEDWIHPHEKQLWFAEYGSALYIADSKDVTVRDCIARAGQNGLVLDGVSGAKVYDNDFSFLSGWGVGMWKSSNCVISRNALDFCVRGYSHGVYNRGQDSAGILMYEQCHDNVIAENSATHGGDGFFGFAGREAIGQGPRQDDEWHKRNGNRHTIIIGNDFSYAAAHGIEQTFSFSNHILNNRLVGNAICGIWGGYSKDFVIAGNRIEDNGRMGYGLERGGINIEHGRGNRIVHNKFINNQNGVHFWWDDDRGLLSLPWVKMNGAESAGNYVGLNEFVGDEVAILLRGPSEAIIGANVMTEVGSELSAEEAVKVVRDSKLAMEPVQPPAHVVLGKKRPVGQRDHLSGRENIIMTKWGPWDHASPLVRKVPKADGSVVYELKKLDAPAVDFKPVRAGIEIERLGNGTEERVRIRPTAAGVHAYSFSVLSGDFQEEVKDELIHVEWKARFFNYPKAMDPAKDREGWRRLVDASEGASTTVTRLRFPFGMRGPGEANIPGVSNTTNLGSDHFGMVAKARLSLPTGKWELAGFGDDGLRVMVDGQIVIDKWNKDLEWRKGTVEITQEKEVEIVVQYFEVDGAAHLDVGLERLSEPPRQTR